MMANERVNEDEAEAILSNLKMEGRSLVGTGRQFSLQSHGAFRSHGGTPK